MGKLHVRAADHLYRLHNFIGLLLQPLLTLLRDGKHGRGTEGISRMNAKRVNIFDKAHGNNIVVRVANHLKLQLFPAENRLLHQHLSHQTGLQPSGAYYL